MTSFYSTIYEKLINRKLQIKMKKLLGAVIVFLFSFVIFGASNQVFALDDCSEVFSRTVSISNFQPSYAPVFIAGRDGSVNATITGLDASQTFTVTCEKNGFLWGWPDYGSYSVTSNAAGSASLVMPTNSCWTEEGEYRLKVTTPTNLECLLEEYEVLDPGRAAYCVSKSVTDENGLNGCFEVNETIFFEFEIVDGDGTPYSDIVGITSNTLGGALLGAEENWETPNADGRVSGSRTVAYASSTMWFKVYAEADPTKEITSCQVTGPRVAAVSCTEEERQNGLGETLGPDTFSLCQQIPENQTEAREACYECTGGGEGDDEGNEGVWTAVGCIKRDPVSILQRIISVGLGISGGVALITFLAAGFIFSTSQGDPKATGQAKEMMTASIIGILFIIFSVTILQFIGYSIFKIPGFGG